MYKAYKLYNDSGRGAKSPGHTHCKNFGFLVVMVVGTGGKEDREDWGCETRRRLAKRAWKRYTYLPCGSNVSLES